jgi:hypothetical protein
MNRYAIEKVLWELVSDPANAAALRTDPGRFLGGFRLGEAEARLLREMDVQALLGLRLNPMLVMRAYQMVHGRDHLPQYLQKLKTA